MCQNGYLENLPPFSDTSQARNQARRGATPRRATKKDPIEEMKMLKIKHELPRMTHELP